MTSALLFMALFAIPSFAEDKDTPIQQYEKIERLLNEEQFEEADRYAHEYNAQDYRGIRRVDGTKKCVPVLKECEGTDLSRQTVRSCLAKIETHCDDRFLTPKWKQTLTQINNGLLDQKESASKQSPLRKLCEDEMMWGYSIQKRPCPTCAWSLSPDLTKLVGQFKSKTECEEARLTDKKSGGDKCYRRFIGNNKKIEIYRIKMMETNPHGTSASYLKFETSEKCATAAKEGFTFYPEIGEPFQIGIKGSKSESRFIGDCEKFEVTVCKKNGSSATDIEDIL